MAHGKAEVFRVFDEAFEASGAIYRARVCGRPRENGTWEAWIEFVPEASGPVLRSQRETTQSNRRNLEGWAERLSRVYLEGSLERTLSLEHPRVQPSPRPPEPPHFEGPAPGRGAQATLTPDDAVVNPFLLHHRGEAVLRRTLEALSAADLRGVVWAYGFAAATDPATLSRSELIELIESGVRDRLDDA